MNAVGKFYVYALFREDGSPFYVGKGHGNRCDHHVRDSRRGRSHKDRIIQGVAARGSEIPIVKIADGLAESVALQYEIALIAAIGRTPDGPLVNLTDGGEGVAGLVHTAEHRAKNSAAQRGRKMSPESVAKTRAAKLGKPLSPQHREKISRSRTGQKPSSDTRSRQSAAHRGKKFSPEHRAALGEAARGRHVSSEQRVRLRDANLGKMASAETKAKISAAGMGRVTSPETKEKLRSAHLGRRNTDESIARMREAAKQRSLRRHTIRAADYRPNHMG